eukprot:jgi/Hompol1/5318/HPOL_000762-RA
MNPQESSAAGSAGPLQRGVVTANHYAPTAEERRIIRVANNAFLGTYLSGLLVGFSCGFFVSKRIYMALHPMDTDADGDALVIAECVGSAATVFGFAMTGELIGRKVGEQRAAQLLMKQLPQDSALRKLLEDK